MIKSMTGYGRVQSVIDGMNITVELKSVNHRYFEFASKIPRNYGFLDDKIKKYIQTRVARGKIDCYISIEMLEAQPADVVINHTLAAGYVKALTELAKVYDLKDDITATAVARYPEILIFDDSFSALDYKTDVKLRSELQKETNGSTTLIVAQRISTILHADQIIVLDEGNIVGKGTHEELLKKNGQYASFYYIGKNI